VVEDVGAWFDAIQASTASVREHGAGIPFHEAGRAHEVVLGSQASGTTYATGLENPGAWVGSPADPAPLPDYRACDDCHQRI
jgi:hypothetical protein